MSAEAPRQLFLSMSVAGFVEDTLKSRNWRTVQNMTGLVVDAATSFASAGHASLVLATTPGYHLATLLWIN